MGYVNKPELQICLICSEPRPQKKVLKLGEQQHSAESSETLPARKTARCSEEPAAPVQPPKRRKFGSESSPTPSTAPPMNEEEQAEDDEAERLATQPAPTALRAIDFSAAACALCGLGQERRDATEEFISFLRAKETDEEAPAHKLTVASITQVLGSLHGEYQVLRMKAVVKCMGHEMCLAGSPETRWEDGGLLNADKAICKGLRTRCHFCSRFGATVECMEQGCRKMFHVACAALTSDALIIGGVTRDSENGVQRAEVACCLQHA
eukprot:NODE_599_length_855_cov_676.088089_g453_i0.p1 GENE.NODE_599_length_855_cov_676.088089_g453_i0~~NODE_599_length_855_cov_676.088089_g453_i0.p1  ORF type:complete len:273 (+),score=51.10 NODE_599_length_855_cov_676.088089_g453_i0:23-820(+)